MEEKEKKRSTLSKRPTLSVSVPRETFHEIERLTKRDWQKHKSSVVKAAVKLYAQLLTYGIPLERRLCFIEDIQQGKAKEGLKELLPFILHQEQEDKSPIVQDTYETPDTHISQEQQQEHEEQPSQEKQPREEQPLDTEESPDTDTTTQPVAQQQEEDQQTEFQQKEPREEETQEESQEEIITVTKKKPVIDLNKFVE